MNEQKNIELLDEAKTVQLAIIECKELLLFQDNNIRAWKPSFFYTIEECEEEKQEIRVKMFALKEQYQKLLQQIFALNECLFMKPLKLEEIKEL